MGRLGSGPRVMGRFSGSRVWARVRASFQIFALLSVLGRKGNCAGGDVGGGYVRGGNVQGDVLHCSTQPCYQAQLAASSPFLVALTTCTLPVPPTLTAVLPRGAALHRRRCGRSSLAGRQCQCHCVYRRSIERRRRVQSIHVRSLATPVGLQLTSTAIYSAIAATFSLDLVHSQDQLTDRQISLRVSINI